MKPVCDLIFVESFSGKVQRKRGKQRSPAGFQDAIDFSKPRELHILRYMRKHRYRKDKIKKLIVKREWRHWFVYDELSC